MRFFAKSAFILIVIILFSGIPSVRAIWYESGVAVCTAPGEQIAPETISDGAGGVIVTWSDNRGGDYDIYAQRLDQDGNAHWAVNGVAVCTASGDQEYPMIIQDGTGGVIITWHDDRSGEDDIYAQKLDANGNTLWQADGVAICTVAGWQRNPVHTSDDAGGAIITWTDNRSGDPDDRDIYAQRIDANGTVLWTADGVSICSSQWNWQQGSAIIPDDSGGAIIVWQDLRTGVRWRLYAQRVEANGNTPWTADGVRVSDRSYDQLAPQMISDGSGGAIITWYQLIIGGEYNICAQRINGSGGQLWGNLGVYVCTEGTANQVWPRIVSDGSRGAIIVWEDYRGGNGDIYIQRVNSGGSGQWTTDGEALCTAAGDQLQPYITSDGAGGAIVTWYDGRNGGTTDIFARRIDASGNGLWAANGIGICTEDGDQLYPRIVPDGASGAIIVWQDERRGEGDIYAQRVEHDGDLFVYPAPYIIGVDDVPDDQGGSITLQWKRSRLDVLPAVEITHYGIWKRVPEGGSNASSGGASPGSAVPAGRIDDSRIAVSSRPLHQSNGYTWEWLFSYPAVQSETYMVILPTPADWTPVDPAYQCFMVSAHTVDPLVFYESPIDSGYSIDNLAPAAPQEFSAYFTVLESPVGIHFSWRPNAESDLAHYAIYNRWPEDFVPDENNLIGTTTDTTFVYPHRVSGCYKLAAVDVHWNMSETALLREEDIPLSTLLQSFTASHTGFYIDISWVLSEVGVNMKFYILRAYGVDGLFEEYGGAEISGEGHTFSFRDERCEPGKTYRYRVDVSDEDGRRVLFETRSISTPVVPLTLFQNHPNPFNPSTLIKYYLPEKSHITLSIYDASGREVICLVSRQEERGHHNIEWSGYDSQGNSVASGVYFYKLTVGKNRISKKMILLR
jgi:hypothetical protein